MTVLTIDDDKFSRKLVVQILTQIGIKNIVEAADGRTGLQALIDSKPHVVICDVDMQPVNGIEFLKTVRSSDSVRDRDVPVIFLSGHGTPDLVKEAMVLGVDSFIAKPPSVAIVKKRIDFVMAGWG